MIYLLDTSAWVNAVTEPESMPSAVINLIRDEPELGIASVSLLETAILHRLGRLRINGSLADLFQVAIARNIHVLELTPAIACATNDLPEDFQGDPFDRTLVATAKVLGLNFITPDPAIRDASACRVTYYRYRPGKARR